MRCGCAECGAYMIHSEGPDIACVCPECGARCSACLGTDSVIPRAELALLKRMHDEEEGSGAEKGGGKETAVDSAAPDGREGAVKFWLYDRKHLRDT